MKNIYQSVLWAESLQVISTDMGGSYHRYPQKYRYTVCQEPVFTRFPEQEKSYLSCAYSEDHSLPSSPFCPSILMRKFLAGK